MSSMSNYATLVSIAFELYDGKQIPRLTEFTNIKDLQTAYEAQSGDNHWFDKSTFEFFGSENLRMFRPGITLEKQSEAPYGINMYSVTAWVYDYERDDRISPRSIYRFDTNDEAEAFASILYDAWYDL